MGGVIPGLAVLQFYLLKRWAVVTAHTCCGHEAFVRPTSPPHGPRAPPSPAPLLRWLLLCPS